MLEPQLGALLAAQHGTGYPVAEAVRDIVARVQRAVNGDIPDEDE